MSVEIKKEKNRKQEKKRKKAGEFSSTGGN
jgi:hypothetical protein